MVYQQLMPGSSGQRVAAFEVLKATPAVRNLIREDKPAQLHSVMQTGRQQGMQTIEQAVQELTYAAVPAEPQTQGSVVELTARALFAQPGLKDSTGRFLMHIYACRVALGAISAP